MPSAVILIAFIVLMIPILAIVLDSDLGKAIARRLERGRLSEGGEHVHDRLVYLESELDRLGKDVERLEDESRFLQNLLAEGPESGRLPPADAGTGGRPGGDGPTGDQPGGERGRPGPSAASRAADRGSSSG